LLRFRVAPIPSALHVVVTAKHSPRIHLEPPEITEETLGQLIRLEQLETIVVTRGAQTPSVRLETIAAIRGVQTLSEQPEAATEQVAQLTLLVLRVAVNT